MSLGWLAGAVRGRALARRRLGEDGVADLASQGSLGNALQFLSASSYGHHVRGDLDLASTRRAVGETSLWHLRVLSGWLPPRGVQLVQRLAGWFELQNIENHAVAVAGGTWRQPPYTLGALATVWPRARDASTLPQLRGTLAHSTWGDPGGDALGDILLGLRLGWSRHLRSTFAPAREWGEGALALAVAKVTFVPASSRPAVTPAVPELGGKWEGVSDLRAFATALPTSARWVFVDVQGREDLWRAERRWWIRVDRDAAMLVDHPSLGRTVVGAAATLLVTDCWRTQAALEQAGRGADGEGPDLGEA